MTADKDLIRRAKKGDTTAFTEIYDCYQPAVFRYIRYRIQNSQDVDDLTSEVFTRLVERIDRFTYRGRPLLAWLYTIARNLVTDYYRRTEREPMGVMDEQFADKATLPEDYADKAYTQQKIMGGLQHLTEDQQHVIIFKFIEDRKSVV